MKWSGPHTHPPVLSGFNGRACSGAVYRYSLAFINFLQCEFDCSIVRNVVTSFLASSNIDVKTRQFERDCLSGPFIGTAE